MSGIILFSENFEDGADGWNYNKLYSNNALGTVLGLHDGSIDLEKTFDIKPEMEDLTIEFDFLEMDSWNNENFSVYLNGLEVSLGTFAFYNNEDGRSGSVNGISWSIDSEAPANEGGGSNYNYDDQVHHVTMTIDNNPGILDSDELTLKFDADLDMGIDNESYGIDNLVISGDLSDSPSLVDNDDFVDADQTDGWSLNSRETIGSLGSVLGRFSGSENVQKSYILHETTEYAQLKFDFIEMDSWDNEEFSVIVNGKEVSLGTFYVYADEGDRTGNTDGITWEFTSDSATNYGGSHWVDQKHYVTMNVPKAYLDFNRVTFEFDAKLNSGVTDESYALDNVSVAGIQSKSITVANETYDFGAFGWSINQTDADDDLAGTAVLGRFTGSQDVEKTFDLPGDTEGIRVEFDFLENDSWNNENFSVYLNGLQVDLGNFNFRNDEGNRSGSQNGVSWTTTSQGAPTDNAFGGYDDQVHRVVLTSTVAALTGDELTVKFDATLNSNVNNESYGIDNFLVKAAVGIVDLLPVDFDTTFENQTISTQIDSSLWDSVNTFGTFLGRFGGDDDVTYGMAFNDYDLASGGKIEFDFLEIDSWNNEEFIVTVNGREVNLGEFNFYADEGDRSGWSNGIRWEFNTTEYGNLGFSHWAEAKHTVTLDFAANTMSGHYLQLEFNAELDQSINNESFGIDNIKLILDGTETIIDNTSASNSALEFAQGHINVGSSLEAGDLLLQGQAMVSIDKTTALYLSQSGNLQLLHDSDGDGDYETDHAVFGNATFDRVGIKASNGALYGEKSDGNGYQEILNYNPGETHEGHRMLVQHDRVSIHEVDGSGITTIGTDGSVRFHDDDVTPTYLVRDRFEGDRDGGWTSTENETDLDFLNGQRLSTLGSTEDGHRHIHGISDLTKMVQLNDVYRQLPLFFEFTFHDGSQNENIQIYLGDMTNQWGEPQPEEHRLKFDIGALSVRTFDPYAGDSDREGKVEIDIVDLGNDAWDVKIRFDGGGAPILPVTGVEGVKLNGIDVAIPKFLKVHVDMGSNGSSDRAKLGDFRVLQYHPNKEPLDTASALVDYYALFDHFTLTHLGAADSQSLENSIGTNITALGGFVKNVDDKLNAHNIADFDFQEYSGYETTPGKNQVDTYFDKLDTALVNLSALTSGENTSSASLADYNALMWGEYVIEDPSITDKALAALAIAGFAIGLASGLGSIALATSALYVAEEIGELELTALGTAEANGTLGGGEIIDGDLFADSFQDPDLYKETAGTAAYWDTGNVKKMGDLATSAGSFGGYAFLSSETFHAGMPDSATAKGLFGSINQPSISDTMTRAVIAFVTSTEAYENSSNPDQTKVNTYNGYAETLEEKLVDFQITAAESVANFTALSFVREYILGPDTKYSVPIVTDAQNKTLDQEEAMWIALGFDVVVSASVARSGVVDLGYGSIHTNYYETTFEIRDGTGDGGTDLEGIDGFHYKVAHEDLYSHKDYYTDFGVWT